MNLRLRTLLASAFAAFAGLAVLGALAMLSLARDGEASASYLVESVRSVESAERIALDLHELRNAAGEPADRVARDLSQAVALNRSMIQSPAEAAIVSLLEASVADLLAARTGAQDDAGRARFEAALAKASEGQGALLQVNLQQARDAEALTMRHGRKATRIAGFAAAFLVAAMIGLILLARSQLIRPLETLRQDIHRLSLGETGVRAKEKRAVELAELASTFNAMAALLDEQRRGRAEILGRVAGALETPLASLRDHLARLSPGAPALSPDELKKLHALIIRQSLQLEQRVVEFLDAARADAGELPLSCTVCDLRELARESVELFAGLSPRHAIQLHAKAPVPVIADVSRLEQVLHALLAVALRRAPGGGAIAVSLQARSGEARLTIAAANGELQTSFETLFNELRQLNAALRDVPGVLFELDVSRKLIEAHGGKIEVDAQGSEFVLALPLAEGAQPGLAAAAQVRSRSVRRS